MKHIDFVLWTVGWGWLIIVIEKQSAFENVSPNLWTVAAFMLVALWAIIAILLWRSK